MKIKYLIFFGVLVLFLIPANAQVGIGAGGGLYYPGLIKSEVHNSRFVAGAGYEIFARHTLFEISPKMPLQAKYAYHFYFSDIDLPFTQETRFTFNFLSICAFIPLLDWNTITLTGGGGLGLLTAHASKDFLSVTESTLIPQLQIGLTKKIGDFFNIFADLTFQYGSFSVRDDVLSITGFRLITGFTMFLTE